MNKLISLISPGLITGLIFMLLFSSCKHEADITAFDEICFERDILPVFQNNCATSGCHNSSTKEAGFDFSNYDGIMKAIKAGDANGSKAYEVLSAVYGAIMPPDNPLPKTQRTLIRLWIEQGAKQTSCNDTLPSDTLVSTYNGLTSHNEGQACMTCHGPGGEAVSQFILAGTVYDSTKLNPYPNATIKLFSQMAGQGNLIATIETDGKGNFFTNQAIDFGTGLFPVAYATTGNMLSMPDFIVSGNCHSCHGQTAPKIWVKNGGPIIQPSDSICFTRDVLPILQSNCAISGCHDASTAEKDYVFESYASTMAKGINPFDPEGSTVYQAIISTESKMAKGITTDKMPPDPRPSLTQTQKNTIYDWIAEGALNLDCSQDPCDLSNVTFSGIVWPIIQNSCTGCHSGTTPSAGIRIEGYADVKTLATSGQLVGTIKGLQGYTQMPLNGSLTNCAINQIEQWVNDGGNNNKKYYHSK